MWILKKGDQIYDRLADVVEIVDRVEGDVVIFESGNRSTTDYVSRNCYVCTENPDE